MKMDEKLNAEELYRFLKKEHEWMEFEDFENYLLLKSCDFSLEKLYELIIQLGDTIENKMNGIIDCGIILRRMKKDHDKTISNKG